MESRNILRLGLVLGPASRKEKLKSESQSSSPPRILARGLPRDPGLQKHELVSQERPQSPTLHPGPSARMRGQMAGVQRRAGFQLPPHETGVKQCIRLDRLGLVHKSWKSSGEPPPVVLFDLTLWRNNRLDQCLGRVFQKLSDLRALASGSAAGPSWSCLSGGPTGLLGPPSQPL